MQQCDKSRVGEHLTFKANYIHTGREISRFESDPVLLVTCKRTVVDGADLLP